MRLLLLLQLLLRFGSWKFASTPRRKSSTTGRLVRQLTAKLGGPAVVKEAQTMSAPAAEAAAGYSMNNFTMTDARRTSGKSMDAVRV